MLFNPHIFQYILSSRLISIMKIDSDLLISWAVDMYLTFVHSKISMKRFHYRSQIISNLRKNFRVHRGQGKKRRTLYQDFYGIIRCADFFELTLKFSATRNTWKLFVGGSGFFFV